MEKVAHAALRLFICRVTCMCLGYSIALRASDPTLFAVLCTQISMSFMHILRGRVLFPDIKAKWAQPLVICLAFLEDKKRENFEDVFKNVEMLAGVTVLAITASAFWLLESTSTFVLVSSLANGLAVALVAGRLQYALRVARS